MFYDYEITYSIDNRIHTSVAIRFINDFPYLLLHCVAKGCLATHKQTGACHVRLYDTAPLGNDCRLYIQPTIY